MKISVKPKTEPTAQFNIRLPLSLKQRLDGLRTRAAECSADFNATLVAVLEEFAVELDTRLGVQRGAASRHPNNLLVWCPVINLHNSCLQMRHHFRLRRDADGGWATQEGAGVER